jgi:hypothetical protein
MLPNFSAGLALRASIACWDSRSFMAVMTQHLPACGPEPAFSISSRNPRSDWSWWGRVIFYHSDVDALYQRLIAVGYKPDTAPRDAE